MVGVAEMVPVTIGVRYDDEPDDYSAIIELEDEEGECSGCGRRQTLVLRIGLARYCEVCTEKIAETW